MVSDIRVTEEVIKKKFQSALRFAVVSDLPCAELDRDSSVSIRFEVRGGFRRDV